MNCAKCGRPFWLHSPVNARWCGNEQVFLCARCAPSGRHTPAHCPFCNRVVSSSLSAAFVLATVFGALSLIMVPIFYADGVYHDQLASTPQARITNLTAGETVMIYGNIATNAPNPTLSAIWVSSGKSGYWEWTLHQFTLYQGSVGILVYVGQVGNHVFGSPYRTNTALDYYPSDPVAVIGVITGGNGSWAITGTSIAPSPSDFSSPGDFQVAEGAGVISLLLGGVMVITWIQGLRRFKQHEARVRQPGMYDYKPLAEN